MRRKQDVNQRKNKSMFKKKKKKGERDTREIQYVGKITGI